MIGAPGVRRAGALLAVLGLAAFAVRSFASTQLPANPAAQIPLFHRPWDRPPLLDLLSVPFVSGRHWLAIALGTLAVLALVRLASDALPRRAVVAVGLVGLLLPSMVWAGAWWAHIGLVLLLTILAATEIAGVLERDGEGFASPAAFAVWVLVLSDWPAWAPVLAWAGWLWVFPPRDISERRVRRAAWAVAAGILAALPVYVGLLLRGANPATALAAREVALGPEALLSIVDALAGVLLGRSRGLPWAVVAGAALVTLTAAMVGVRRARAGGRPGWGDVLLVGSLGAFVPALAAQPWIPLAADKHVWYMAPLVVCLGAAAIFGVRGGKNE